MPGLSFPITVKCDEDPFLPDDGKRIKWILAWAVVAVVLFLAFFAAPTLGRFLTVIIKCVAAVAALVMLIKFSLRKREIVIDARGLTFYPKKKGDRSAAPVRREFDEFESVQIERKKKKDRREPYSNDYPYFILLRGKPGKDDMRFDQPGTIGENSAYDFARKLGEAANLKVIDNEW